MQLQNNVLLLHSQKLSYGVMVTQQILVLSFQVRVLVAQPEKRETSAEVSLFFVKNRAFPCHCEGCQARGNLSCCSFLGSGPRVLLPLFVPAKSGGKTSPHGVSSYCGRTNATSGAYSRVCKQTCPYVDAFSPSSATASTPSEDFLFLKKCHVERSEPTLAACAEAACRLCRARRRSTSVAKLNICGY